VHEISCLKVEGSYLYSAGEEGVVVMWHLRENRKDFLPRIGGKIVGIVLREAQLYCLLADNTIKRIDLGEDKTVVEYRVVVNPKATPQTKPIKNNIVRVSALENSLFMLGLPGRLQEINLSNGLNTEHSIVGRNLVSRLDDNHPQPHQITDVMISINIGLFHSRWREIGGGSRGSQL
jgi:hypothetical protein